MHKLSVTFEPLSKAKARLWFVRRSIKEVVSGEKFDVTFSIQNEGDADFPGGVIEFVYKSPVHVHSASAEIARIGIREAIRTKPIEFKAAGAGDAGIFCEVKSSDSQPVVCGGQDMPGAAICIGYSSQAADRPEFWFKILAKQELDSRYRQILIIVIAAVSFVVAVAALIVSA